MPFPLQNIGIQHIHSFHKILVLTINLLFRISIYALQGSYEFFQVACDFGKVIIGKAPALLFRNKTGGPISAAYNQSLVDCFELVVALSYSPYAAFWTRPLLSTFSIFAACSLLSVVLRILPP